MYQIKGNPIGLHFPPLVAAWLKRIKAKGEKTKDIIVFKVASLRESLTKERVPHVADFLEENKVEEIAVLADECEEEI